MKNYLIYIQYFGIILLLFEIACTLYQTTSFNQSMMLIFTTASLINTIGYLLELQADNKELALYAVKFIYIGKPYIILSLFLFVLKYCRITYPKVLGITLFSIHTFIIMSVLTCEYQNWFYTKISFTMNGLYPHLVLGHGFLYYVYIIMIVIYSICMVMVCGRRFRHSKDRSERYRLVYLIAITLIPLISFIIYITNVTQGYDVTAPSYILCATLLLICSLKYDFLNTLRVAKDDVLDNLRDGIVFVNNYLEPIYLNQKARELYAIFSSIHQEETDDEFRRLLAEGKNLLIGDEVYSIHKDIVHNNKKKMGSLIKIENVTVSYYYTKQLRRDVNEKTKEVNQMQKTFITSFATLVEARDGVTGTHIKNTSHYVYLLCQELKKHNVYKDILTDDYIDIIVEAAPLHDIGKISIPDAILQKPEKLNKDEFEIIMTHAALGEEIILEIMDETGDNLKLKTASKMAKYHHERWDGKGYPLGLTGEEIPVCARIMAICDVYDALLSKRSYKEPMSKCKALALIKEGSGTQFDPVMTEIFLSLDL